MGRWWRWERSQETQPYPWKSPDLWSHLLTSRDGTRYLEFGRQVLHTESTHAGIPGLFREGQFVPRIPGPVSLAVPQGPRF